MKKIVVPIDFSNASVNALELAIEIANKSSADIHLVNVIKVGRFDFFKGVESVSTKGDFEEILQKYEQKVKGNLDYSVKKGTVYREIVNFANEMEVDIIVMGSHGLSGFEEIWAGSNAFKVVSESKCPVLTLRESTNVREIKRIVMPVDTTFGSRHKVPMTCKMAQNFGAEVHVLGTQLDNDELIVRKLNNYINQTSEYFTEHGVSNVVSTVKGSNATEITIKHAQAVGADLISVMTEQDDPFSSLLLGSYAQQMVHHSPIPVMCNHLTHEAEFRLS